MVQYQIIRKDSHKPFLALDFGLRGENEVVTNYESGIRRPRIDLAFSILAEQCFILYYYIPHSVRLSTSIYQRSYSST